MKYLLLATIAAVVLVGCGNPEADRALYKAAGNGNIEVVKQHLAAGANVNPKFVNGVTPLHRVASNGHKEIVELLIANGADVNAKSENGGAPLDITISAEIRAILRKHGGKTKKELKAEGK